MEIPAPLRMTLPWLCAFVLGAGAAVAQSAAPGPARTAQPKRRAFEVPGGSGPYRIVIQQVDTSAFPEVKLEFQVYAREPDAPAFEAGMGVRVSEEVYALGMGDRPARDVSPVEICRENDVVMAVVVDIPGQVAPYIAGIRSGAAQSFRRLAASGGSRNRASLMALAEVPRRFPETGFSGDLAGLEAEANRMEVGTGSPVWRNVAEEVERVAAYQAPTATGGTLVKTVVLVADGTETTQEPPEVNQARIRAAAMASGTMLVTLGYGQVFEGPMRKIAGDTGGFFVDGVDQSVEKVLGGVVDGARRTWCLSYRSPHTDVVNETATVKLAIGGSTGEAPYALPFLVAEDSKEVELFFPVADRVAAAEDPTPPPALEAGITLVEADGREWRALGRPERPLTATVVPVAAGDWRLLPPGARTGTGPAAREQWSGFAVRLPEELLRVPTEYADPSDTVAPVPHFRIAVRPAPAPGPVRPVAVSGRLSVQDRTPPAVRVRISSQDGSPAQGLRFHEAPIDREPALLAGPRPSDEDARRPGPGSKSALAALQGREPDGAETVLTLEDLPWTVDLAADLGQGRSASRLLLWAGARARLEVLAMDNFAMVSESTQAWDREVFEAGAVGPHREPRYADPDRARLPAPGEEPGPSFLPRRTRRELDADPRAAGVTWWIESPGDPTDRQRGLEHLDFVSYPFSDRKATGPDDPGAPAPHVLRVLARDGSGNLTDLTLPLRVEDLDFTLRRLAYDQARTGAD